MIDRKDKTLNSNITISNDNDENNRVYSIPVKAHLSVEDDQLIESGQIIAKIPRLTSS